MHDDDVQELNVEVRSGADEVVETLHVDHLLFLFAAIDGRFNLFHLNVNSWKPPRQEKFSAFL